MEDIYIHSVNIPLSITKTWPYNILGPYNYYYYIVLFKSKGQFHTSKIQPSKLNINFRKYYFQNPRKGGVESAVEVEAGVLLCNCLPMLTSLVGVVGNGSELGEAFTPTAVLCVETDKGQCMPINSLSIGC